MVAKSLYFKSHALEYYNIYNILFGRYFIWIDLSTKIGG